MARFKQSFITCLLILTTFFALNVSPVLALTYSRDPYSTASWHHDFIDTQEAWDLLDQYVPNNKPVLVASIDTGCDKTDKDLIDNLDLEDCVKISGDEVFKDSLVPKYNHGTAVASLIAAVSNNNIGIAGVAAGNNNNIVRLMCINVATEKRSDYLIGKRRDTTTKNIINGMYYAAEHGARVIHMCLGHDKTYRDANNKKFNTKKIQKAITHILNKYPGIIMIASAGNKGSTKKWYMSDYKGVFSVINTKQYSNMFSKEVKAGNSNYGSKNISAPGRGIMGLSYSEDTSEHGGTSASSAVAAGVAALVIYANPSLKGHQVKDIICRTATDLYDEGYDKYTAYGNVNAYNAVIKALQKAGYNNLPEIQKTYKTDFTPVQISYETTKKSITIHWTRSYTNFGKLNQYRVCMSRSANGAYKRMDILNAEQFTYKFKSNNKLKGTYYFKIKPYGTTPDGKMLVSNDDGNSNVIEINVK